MKHENLIRPIRTRGAIQKPSINTKEAHFPDGLKTRGRPVRTVSSSVAVWPVSSTEHPSTLEDLVKDLKKNLKGLPLTLILHGWGTESTTEFFYNIVLFLDEEDALWLVLAADVQNVPEPPIGVERATILNIKKDLTAQRLYDNLMADWIFLSRDNVTEEMNMDKWKQRTRAIVIDRRNKQCDNIATEACRAGIKTYIWTDGTKLK